MKNKEMNVFSQKILIEVYFKLGIFLRPRKAAVSTSMPFPEIIYRYTDR